MAFLVLLDVATSLFVIAMFLSFAYYYARWWRRYPADREDAPEPWRIVLLIVWAAERVAQPAITTVAEPGSRAWRVPLNVAFNVIAALGMFGITQSTARRKARGRGDVL